MAPQDYVKRGRPQKRKNNRHVTKQAKAPRPWFKMTIAVVLIACFGYFLYFLQQGPVVDLDPEINQQVPGQVSPKVEAQNDQDKLPLPQLKEEDWAFIDDLPEYSVEVDVEELPTSGKTYIMQCGSFKRLSQAEELRAQIAFQGFESEVVESNGSNGRWFRVVLGPYERKRQAESERHHLRRSNILSCKIW